MKKKNLIRLVESFIVLPVITMSGTPMGTVSQAVIGIVNTPSTISVEKQNSEDPILLALDDAKEIEEQRKAKAEAIDAYFRERDMPLAGLGMKMVLEAEKNGLDWRLLPAIAVRESSGGKNACETAENSFFGWGSCKINFSSNEQAIEVVAHNLGGNNPKTAHHYDEKDTMEILRAYNPPSIVPKYAEQVVAIMNAIGEADIISENSTLALAK